MHSGSRPLFAALIGLLVASCGLQNAPALPADADAIAVGATLSLTGSLSRDGQLVKEGYLFCQEWLNGHGGLVLNGRRYRLDIRMVDDASRVSVSADNTERLVAQHIDLLLGPSSNATTQRNAAIAEAHQVPMVQSNGISESIFNSHYRYVFGVIAPASRQMEGVIDMALNQAAKPQTVAILSANDTLSSEVGTEIRDYASGRGLNVVYFDSYPSGTNDLRDQLATAAAAGPDLLLLSGNPDESIVAIKQAQQLNLQPRLIGFTDDQASNDLIGQLKTMANDTVGTTQWSPLAKVPSSTFLSGSQYTAEYTARFGHPPDQHGAGATAACVTLAAAIEKAGSASAARVRDALANLDLQTFFGEIRFDDRGANPSKAVFVEQVQKGATVVVWPPEAAGAIPVYPASPWNKR